MAWLSCVGCGKGTLNEPGSVSGDNGLVTRSNVLRFTRCTRLARSHRATLLLVCGTEKKLKENCKAGGLGTKQMVEGSEFESHRTRGCLAAQTGDTHGPRHQARVHLYHSGIRSRFPARLWASRRPASVPGQPVCAAVKEAGSSGWMALSASLRSPACVARTIMLGSAAGVGHSSEQDVSGSLEWTKAGWRGHTPV